MLLYERIDPGGLLRDMRLLSREDLELLDEKWLIDRMSEPIPGFVPTRYELLLLALHWTLEALRREEPMSKSQRLDCRSTGDADAAWKRVRTIESLLEGREVQDLIEDLTARHDEHRGREQENRKRLLDQYQEQVLDALTRFPNGVTTTALAASTGISRKVLPKVLSYLRDDDLVRQCVIDQFAATNGQKQAVGWNRVNPMNPKQEEE